MGRPHTESSPELKIKVHNGHPPPPQHRSRQGRPSRPPPPAFEPFKKWFPWLVPVIVMANIVLFILTMYYNDCPHESGRCLYADTLGRFAFQRTRENPLFGPSAKTLLKMGAMQWSAVVERKEVWRLVSCMWLHAGVIHIVSNMVSLLFVGIRLEQEFGFVRIGLLYVISGIGGSMLSCLFIRNTISVGASGALFGLLGCMLSELLTNWTIYANKCGALLSLVSIILINIAVGILPHVDNFAHLGGFLTGFFLGFVILIRPQFGWVNHKTAPPGYYAAKPKSKYKKYQLVLLMLSMFVLISGFTGGLVSLLGGVNGNDHCSFCHYLSCVSTPLWKCDDQCSAMQEGNQVILQCLGNGRSGNYTLTSQDRSSEVAQLCSSLCH
ncbi:RHOMBOID-like protein 1 [Heracleum sosnowskyi]|uniref:RHOMBOID-like protein n=1 Tax=Heracleum sosnowskyi TaxID=360622 RepID=A0AAD8GYV8_9APIA|nr:RHOMBOID-like protein 1 [Heracleum sosnowskyi]